MRNTEARALLCPFKLGLLGVRKTEKLCETTGCMGWEEHYEAIYKNDECAKVPSNTIGTKPKDPPQGHCAMVPPTDLCANIL